MNRRRRAFRLNLSIVVFIAMTLMSSRVWAITWDRTLGKSSTDLATSVEQTHDGGYIVAGITESSAAGFDVWVIKLGAEGNVQWQKTYGGSKHDSGSYQEEARSVHQTRDGGYVVAGSSESFGAGNFDFWLLKLDASGNIMWQKTYGGRLRDEAYAVQQTLDGGYILAGEAFSFGAGNFDAWLLKLDATGNVIWQKTYGGTDWDSAQAVQQTRDSGYILAGKTRSFGGGDFDMWLLKLDGAGNVTWQRAFGGTNLDEAWSVQQTRNGGYIVSGDTRSFGTGNLDMWLLNLDRAGNIIWQKSYVRRISADYAFSVKQTHDSGYIVAGYSSILEGGDMWLLKLDAAGNVTWQKTYGTSNNDLARSVQQTRDGGYIVAGHARFSGSQYYDMWLLKLDSAGNVNACSFSIEESDAAVVQTTGKAADSFAKISATKVVPESTQVVPSSTSANAKTRCRTTQ